MWTDDSIPRDHLRRRNIHERAASLHGSRPRGALGRTSAGRSGGPGGSGRRSGNACRLDDGRARPRRLRPDAAGRAGLECRLGSRLGWEWISAAQFTADDDLSSARLVFRYDDGFYEPNPGSGTDTYFIDLNLDPGLHVYTLTCAVNDPAPTTDIEVEWRKYTVDLQNDTAGWEYLDQLETQGEPGYTSLLLLAPPDEVTHVWEPGSGDLVRHVIRVIMGQDTTFAGCAVLYQRQVAPGPDTATFDDVPETHPFFQHIEALVATGVTSAATPTATARAPRSPAARWPSSSPRPSAWATRAERGLVGDRGPRKSLQAPKEDPPMKLTIPLFTCAACVAVTSVFAGQEPVPSATGVTAPQPQRRVPRRVSARPRARRPKSTPPLDVIAPSRRQRDILVRKRKAELEAGTIRRRRRPLARRTVPLDGFPYQAQDFAANERVLWGRAVHNPDDPESTWQQYAYDLGVSRPHADGIWRDLKPTIDWNDPQNSDYYAYGKPVYAISEGVIVNCWRNAPENPRPFSAELDDPYDGMPLSEMTWLHEDTRAGEVYGAGNFVLVREDNGNYVGYAHGQPGTVLPALCPHNGTHLSPDTWEEDSAVPVDLQVRVARGDFLFKTGNAGTSSAPHLHIDRAEADKATSVPLRFRNGLAMPLDGAWGRPQNAQWTSFAGQPLPPGPTLIWPPRRAGGLWSWHGQDGETWSDFFAHMADSGYAMSWIDGYSVGGKPYFNTIWRPATAPWYGYALLTGAEYQATYDRHTEDGYALVHVDSVLAGGRAHYNAIFVKDASTDFVARHGENAAQFDATFQDVTDKGYSPVNASVISVDGQLRYTTLYRKQNLGGWVLLPGIAKRDYQSVYEENAALGRRPSYVNAYKHGNEVYYSVVFSQHPQGPRKDRHGMSPAAYQSEFESAGRLAIQAVSGVDGAVSNHEYIATWREE